MKDSAREKFLPESESFEGVCDFMYLDVKCLVTTGIGNLIDPISTALGLPWKRKDGSDAGQSEISAEWSRIKNLTSVAAYGGGYYKKFTTLHLEQDGLEKLFSWRLGLNETFFRKRFDDYEEWTADAQLAMHLFAWACGPALDDPHTPAIDGIYPKLAHALAAGDWLNASREAWIGPILKEWKGEPPEQTVEIRDYAGKVHKFAKGNPDTPLGERKRDPRNDGIHPRNLAIVKCLRNAHAVEGDASLVRDKLYYPRELWTPDAPTDALPSEPTLPASPAAFSGEESRPHGELPTEALEELEKERQKKPPEE